MKNNTYDAIVVGSGITGGWAAKELTQKGLRTLVLERGRNVEHPKDYRNTYKAPWDYKYLGARFEGGQKGLFYSKQEVQLQCR